MTTLYLVSAIQDGIPFWKVGITHHEDPLKRDPERYQEVFRAVRMPSRKAALKAEAVIARCFRCLAPVIGKESLSTKVQLMTVLELFDSLVENADKFAHKAFTTTYEKHANFYDYHRQQFFNDEVDQLWERALNKHGAEWREIDELLCHALQDLCNEAKTVRVKQQRALPVLEDWLPDNLSMLKEFNEELSIDANTLKVLGKIFMGYEHDAELDEAFVERRLEVAGIKPAS